jgi:hypothetical protein
VTDVGWRVDDARRYARDAEIWYFVGGDALLIVAWEARRESVEDSYEDVPAKGPLPRRVREGEGEMTRLYGVCPWAAERWSRLAFFSRPL